MSLLEHNIAANGGLFSSPEAETDLEAEPGSTPAPEARVLDWDDDLPDYIPSEGIDLIVYIIFPPHPSPHSYPSSSPAWPT